MTKCVHLPISVFQTMVKKEGNLMEADSLLPSEIWLQILETGVQYSTLSLSDISSFSITCKYFSNLSNDNSLWSLLLTLHFPFKSTNQQSSNQSIKSLYKYRLKRSIRRKISRIQGEVLKDEFLFNLLVETIQEFQSVVVDANEKVKHLSAKFVPWIDSCEMQYVENIERCHGRMLLMNEQLMDFSAELIRMVEEREIRQACHEQVTVVEATDPPSHLLEAPTSNIPAEILVYLEAKVDDLIVHQQRFLDRQKRQQSRVNNVLRRHQEHNKLLALFKLHLDLFGPTEVEDGSGEHDDSDNLVDGTEDDDVDADVVFDYDDVDTDTDMESDNDGNMEVDAQYVDTDMESDNDDDGNIEVDAQT